MRKEHAKYNMPEFLLLWKKGQQKATESPRSGGLRENFLFVWFLNKALSVVNMKAFCIFFNCYIRNTNFSLCLHFQPDAAGHLTNSSWGKNKPKQNRTKKKKSPPSQVLNCIWAKHFFFFFFNKSPSVVWKLMGWLVCWCVCFYSSTTIR